MDKKPQRMCVSCRASFDKDTLLKFCKKLDGTVDLDLKGTASGRGGYVCKNSDCINKMLKTHALNRAFRTQITDENYEQIKNKIGDISFERN